VKGEEYQLTLQQDLISFTYLLFISVQVKGEHVSAHLTTGPYFIYIFTVYQLTYNGTRG